MRHAPYTAPTAALALAGSLTLASTAALAQSADDDWRFRATGYVFVPDVTASALFPTGAEREMTIQSDTLLENTDLAVMGAFEVQKGRWGAFVDMLYFNVSPQKSGSREVAIDGVPLPVDVTADLDADIRLVITTMAGTVRVVSTPAVTFDAFGGARFLAAKATLDFTLSAAVGGLGGPSRSGSSEIEDHAWDAIGGVKGRVTFGPNRRFFVPFYVDAGAGESDLTWQALAGVGYAFGWGEVIGGWRYLDYDMKAERRLDSITFNGPIAGVGFRW